MNKPFKPTSKTKYLIINTSVFVTLVIAGLALFQYNRTRSSCEITPEMKQSGIYYVPCEVIFTVSESAPPSQDRIKQIVDSVDGKVIEPRFDFGVYVIKVDPGTEKETIKKLKNIPEVTSATRDGCCAVAN